MGDGKFRVSFYLDKHIIDVLYYGSALEFDADFPHAHRDFDPSVTFSLNGFRSAFLALLKQRE